MAFSDIRSPIVLPRYTDPKTARHMAELSEDVPRVPWPVFMQRFDWQQGEHVGLIGTTGSGKTNLLEHILPLRTYVAVAATKPRDVSMDRLIASGYARFDRWPGPFADNKTPRRVIWPEATRRLNTDAEQEAIFKEMWHSAFVEEGWCLVTDEGAAFATKYKMKPELIDVWDRGRSLGVSQVVATQRPKHIPLEIYTQSNHLFFWQMNDKRDLETAGLTNARNPELMRKTIVGLEKYQVLYVNTRTGQMMRTRPPAPSYLDQGGV